MTPMLKPAPLKVGVSIYLRDERQSLWENGIGQNCLFLAMLFMRSPCVAQTYLVAGGNAGLIHSSAMLAQSPVPVISMADAMHTLDVMIEMGVQLDREWSIAFRSRGGRIITMRVGNDYVLDVERMIHNQSPAMLVSGAPYDEVWTIAEYVQNCAPYYQANFRAPVRIMPHLWSPVLLERSLSELAPGKHIGYVPGRARWRIGMFEPNVSMVKTSFISMLCCEAAHRANRQVLEKVWVYNGQVLRERPGFINFSLGLDIARHGLVSLEGRHPFVEAMIGRVDAIVTHQWENAQNYIYYEALYGNYPLIHNSHLLGDCGYRYSEFDAEEGGRALLQAFAEHDNNLDDYRRRSQAYLQSVDPHNVDNIRIYSEALLEVWCRTEGGQPSFEVPVSNRPDAMVTPTVRKSRSRTDAGRRIKSEPQKNHQPEALK
ncbi:DUF2827 domain-containing protein [Herbaspirillum huttiense]|uniref:DUF2827 domain-containing protein n=1 Tax=Herbaspirillum huttiense TaxID=863372 RepID=UPI003B3B546C